jgi:hypothetical protein
MLTQVVRFELTSTSYAEPGAARPLSVAFRAGVKDRLKLTGAGEFEGTRKLTSEE